MTYSTTVSPDALILNAIERPIAVPPIFKRVAGSAAAAIFLSQAWYWTKTLPKSRQGWFYKTQKEWEEETGLTRYEQETARKHLIKLGLLSEQRKGNPARLWFCIEKDNLAAQIAATLRTSMQDPCNLDCDDAANKDVEVPQSLITESTAENTTESDTPSPGHEITPQVKPLPSNGPEQQVVKAFYESIGVAQPPNYSKAIGQAKTILKTGIEPSEIPGMVAWAKTQWFAKDGFGLGDLARFAEQYRTSEGSVSAPTPLPDRDLTQAELREFKRWDEGWQAVYGNDSDAFNQWIRDLKAGTLRQRNGGRA